MPRLEDIKVGMRSKDKVSLTVFPLRLLTDYEIEHFLFPLHFAVFNVLPDVPEPESVVKPVSYVELSVAEKLGWKRVATGEVTNSNCGRQLKYMGCNDVEKHDFVSLDGVNHKGEVYVQIVYGSCGKASCPICAKFGWAVRQAKVVEKNIKEVSKKLGQPEHIVVSVPCEWYGLKYETIRNRVMKGLHERGITSGFIIPHAERFANKVEAKWKNVPFGWRFSLHFHVIGFITGGFGRCRSCSKVRGSDYGKPCESVCEGCSGFEAVTRRMNEKDSLIVKVAEDKSGAKRVRNTIGGTVWYQLNHASYRIGNGRGHPHVGTYFGACKGMKLTVEKKEACCPLCGGKLEQLDYLGSKTFEHEVVLARGRQVKFFTPMNEGQGDVWVKHVKGSLE
jgi:hypothetical protein